MGFGSRHFAKEEERRTRAAVKEAQERSAILRAPPILVLTHEEAERAFEAWGANCGPAAICAVTGMTLAELRPSLGDFEQKHYTNPTLMFEVLARLGVRFQVMYRGDEPLVRGIELPDFGVARIQFGGPWTKPGVPMRARYRQTHWIATCRGEHTRGIFDVNCLNSGGWVGAEDWARIIVPALTSDIPRADGSWWVTHGIEVFR